MIQQKNFCYLQSVMNDIRADVNLMIIAFSTHLKTCLKCKYLNNYFLTILACFLSLVMGSDRPCPFYIEVSKQKNEKGNTKN